MTGLGKWLITAGVVLIGAGLLFSLFGKVSGFGKLPGDFYVRKGNFSFYFPLATCVLISLILTLFFNLFGRK